MTQLQKLETQDKLDENGYPAGGTVKGIGLSITWQDGASGRGGDRVIQNGALVEDVLTACLGRMKFHQTSKLSCPENVLVISALEEAIQWLRNRTDDREKRLVEGTNEA
jgi:hypothetical protein